MSLIFNVQYKHYLLTKYSMCSSSIEYQYKIILQAYSIISIYNISISNKKIYYYYEQIFII